MFLVLRSRLATSSMHKRHHQQGLLLAKTTGLRFNVLEATTTRFLFLNPKPFKIGLHFTVLETTTKRFLFLKPKPLKTGLRFTVLEATTTRFLFLNPKPWKLYTAPMFRVHRRTSRLVLAAVFAITRLRVPLHHGSIRQAPIPYDATLPTRVSWGGLFICLIYTIYLPDIYESHFTREDLTGRPACECLKNDYRLNQVKISN